MLNKSLQTLRIPFTLTPMSILEFDLNVALTFFSIEFRNQKSCRFKLFTSKMLTRAKIETAKKEMILRQLGKHYF